MPRGRPPKEKELKLPLIIAEFKSGKTAPQIAKQYGVSRQAIEKCCARHGFRIRDLQAYKEHKADLLAFKQSQILDSMGPDKISEASLRDQATAFNILHNAEKLERGQATSNINIHALTADIETVDAEIVKLSKLLAAQRGEAPTEGGQDISPDPEVP